MHSAALLVSMALRGMEAYVGVRIRNSEGRTAGVKSDGCEAGFARDGAHLLRTVLYKAIATTSEQYRCMYVQIQSYDARLARYTIYE